jgi:serine/threonine-protein kinase
MEGSQKILNDRYELLERAGTGGMSTVYKGRDLMLGRIVAIKVLHESLTSDAEFLRRFQKEAHDAANLTHPNIVTVHDIGQDGRQYFIVMEYVEGWTLKDLIRRQYKQNGKPLSVDHALEVAIQICAGVGYAHRANLIHCDIKSQNVLVARDRRVKVTDFGIARAMTETSLHDANVVWGTPQYFSPEQAAGESPTHASDVYSIGVIMFEMLTSRLPFEADSHTALAVKHMRQQPPSVTSYNPAVTDQLENIIAKVLSKEPSGRYRTADQLGRVLTTYRENSFGETGIIGVETALDPKVSELETVFVYPVVGQTIGSKMEIQQSETDPNLTRRSEEGKQEIHYMQMEPEQSSDWTSIALGALALISLLGLIPLWYLVYLRYTG